MTSRPLTATTTSPTPSPPTAASSATAPSIESTSTPGSSTAAAPTLLRSETSRRLSDPRPLAESLARCVVEVLAGTRDLDQISRWLSADVYAHLLKRVVLSARARQVRGEAPTRLTFTMGTTVLCEPQEGIVEAVVIVHGRARSRAVAIRLEALESRWRASAVHVL